MQGLSYAEFARQSGCSDGTVKNAVARGRLKLLPEGGVDPRQLDKDWRVRAPNRNAAEDRQGRKKPGRKLKKPDEVNPTKRAKELADAYYKKEASLAALREMEWHEKAGSLVDAQAADRTLFELGRAARDQWLNWPARVAPLIAAELNLEPDVMMRLLTKYVHQQVSAMGEPDAHFGRSEA